MAKKEDTNKRDDNIVASHTIPITLKGNSNAACNHIVKDETKKTTTEDLLRDSNSNVSSEEEEELAEC